MNTRNLMTTLIFLFVAASHACAIKAQDDLDQKAVEQRMASLEKRLDRIDKRLDRIENVLFATIRYSEAEARRQLEEAKETFAQSERLHAQGLLTALQLELDRMALDRASTLLNMCVNKEDHRKIGATIAMLDAKQFLRRKQQDLLYAEKLFRKGFVAKTQVMQDRSEVVLAEQNLKLAEEKLKELKSTLRSGKPTTKKK